MNFSHQNFYPESLTYLFEFGRSPDLRLAIGLPRIISSDYEGNNKLNSLQLREQLWILTRFPFNPFG
jgi:hypothetical protein